MERGAPQRSASSAPTGSKRALDMISGARMGVEGGGSGGGAAYGPEDDSYDRVTRARAPRESRDPRETREARDDRGRGPTIGAPLEEDEFDLYADESFHGAEAAPAMAPKPALSGAMGGAPVRKEERGVYGGGDRRAVPAPAAPAVPVAPAAKAYGPVPPRVPAETPMPNPADASDRYVKMEKLGEGTYGVVYKAKDRHTGQFVALKKVRMDAWEEGVPATAMREISVLKEVHHTNIVQLLNVFVSYSGNLYLVFELLARDLKQYMDACRMTGMDIRLVKSYLIQLLRGTEACHAHRIIHRDLKPQNVLLSRDGGLKLADFGLARVYNLPLRVYTHEVVTLWYRAPEVLLGAPVYGAALDVWSIGCMFVEMLTRCPLFPGDSEIDQLYRIFQVTGTPTEATWPGVTRFQDYHADFPKWKPKKLSKLLPTLPPSGIDLVSRMLTCDPMKRISAQDALRHPYLNEMMT